MESGWQQQLGPVFNTEVGSTKAVMKTSGMKNFVMYNRLSRLTKSRFFRG